jgi:hypothetical protein
VDRYTKVGVEAHNGIVPLREDYEPVREEVVDGINRIVGLHSSEPVNDAILG